MLTRLAIQIQERLHLLTPGEKELGTFILENQHSVLGMSAAQLAREAGTSKSTATRFFRSLGYESFEAVRLQARRDLDQIRPGRVPEQTRPTRVGSPEAFLLQEVANVSQTIEGFASDAMNAIAKGLAEAQSIWIVALGDEAPLGSLAARLFANQRSNVRLVAEGGPQLYADLASLSPRDAVFFFTPIRRERVVTFIAEQVRASGCPLFALADIGVPAPLESRVVARCRGTVEGGRSLTATVSLVQLIAAQLAVRLGARAGGRRAMIEALREADRE
jgi:DNA-binding MurR/RpiR family transcriptional regulator